MRIALMMTLCIGLSATVMGQDRHRPIKEAVVHQKMLERIDALEKRLSELESKWNQGGESKTKPQPPKIWQAPGGPRRSAPQPILPQPSLPQRRMFPEAAPIHPDHAYPTPYSLPPRDPVPDRYRPAPSNPPQSTPPSLNQGVPKGWQRFEFNGQSYYIVPADQATTFWKSR